jgi:hypothetical protein
MAITAGPKVVEDGLVLSYDFANKKSFSANVHPGSTNIYDWYVGIRGNDGANQSTLSKDTIESPVGNTPLRMDVTGSDPHLGSYNSLAWNLDEATSGDTWTVSVYAKASTNTTCAIFIFGINASGQYIEAPAGSRSITTEWQRISFTHTFANSNTVYIQSRLDGPEPSGAGQTVWFDGWQVERGSTATNFTSFHSGGNILDLSRKGNAGNLVNSPAFSEDKYGALVFDGSNDYIDFSAPAIASSNTATVEMWCKIKSFSNTMPFGWFAYDVYCSGGQMGYNTFNSDRYGLTSTQVTDLELLNNWKHYVFEMRSDVSYTNNKIYVNGENQSLSQTVGTESSGNRSFNNGNGRISGVRLNNLYRIPMDCAIFKVYDRALTPIEIKQNFEATRGRFNI